MAYCRDAMTAATGSGPFLSGFFEFVAAGLGFPVFRVTDTCGGTAKVATHESPRTTKLYDRTGDEITLDEVEQITI
jgi:hypothetical protein